MPEDEIDIEEEGRVDEMTDSITDLFQKNKAQPEEAQQEEKIPLIGVVYQKEKNRLILAHHEDLRKVVAMVDLSQIHDKETFVALVDALDKYYNDYFKENKSTHLYSVQEE